MIKLRLAVLYVTLFLMLSACNISVTSFPSSSQRPAVSPTEIPATPSPATAAPQTIDAPIVESPALIDIRFLDELNAWGVTQKEIVRTNDGGATWYNITPPDLSGTDATIDFFVLDKAHAWVQKPDYNNYPKNGLLYRTTDGGETWTISSTPFSGGDLSFIDVNNGWMLADLGVGAGSNAVAVFQTKDGGATWTQTYTNDPNEKDAGSSLPLGGLKSNLLPLNMQTAWVGGVIYTTGTAYLYRTEDGGHTWIQVKLELPPGQENAELDIDRDQMQFVSAKDGFLVIRLAGDSTQTAVYTTSNGGDTWTLTPTLLPNAGKSRFLSAQEMVMYNGEQFYVTRDAARTWTTVSPNIVFGDSFVTLDFISPNTGWVVTRDPLEHHSLYRTNDGGATWRPVIP